MLKVIYTSNNYYVYVPFFIKTRMVILRQIIDTNRYYIYFIIYIKFMLSQLN